MDILRIRTQEEIRKKQARRKKRDREKAKAKGGDRANVDGVDADDAMDIDDQKINLTDLFTPYLVVRSNGKIRSLSFSEDTDARDASQVLIHYYLPPGPVLIPFFQASDCTLCELLGSP